MGIGIGHDMVSGIDDTQNKVSVLVSVSAIMVSSHLKMKYIYLNPILYIQLENIACKVPNTVKIM